MSDNRLQGGDILIPSLTILDVELSDLTHYRMRATNRDGTKISSSIYLYVYANPPTIYLPKTSYTVNIGFNVTLELNVTFTPSLTDLFWERRNTTTSSYSPIDMSDNRFQGGDISFPSLTILDVEVSDGMYYRMQATNRDGTTVSSPIYLNISTNPPTIYFPNTYYTVYSGSNVTFDVNVTSTQSLTDLFWERRNTTTNRYSPIDMSDTRLEGGNISFPSLIILDVGLSDRTYFRIRATNRDGTTISLTIYLYVFPNPPTIYVPNTSYRVYSGYNVTFDVNVTSTLSLTDLFWERRNTTTSLYSPIDMSDNRLKGGDISVPSLTILDVEVSDWTHYRIWATNRDGTKNSSSIYLHVYANPPTIYLPKTSYTVNIGFNVTFELNVTFTPSLTDLYWERRNTTTSSYSPIDLSDNRFQGGDISFPSLTILAVEVSDGAYYRMQATNRDGTTVSSTIYLNISTNLPTIYLPSTYYTVYSGRNVTFKVNVTSTPSLTDLFWESKNTTTNWYSPIDMSDNRLEGGNISFPSLIILDVGLSDWTYYRMRATNRDGTTFSSTIYLNVLTNPPTIYLPKTSYTVYTGSSITFEVNVTSTPSLADLLWERRNTTTHSYSPIDLSDNRLQGGDISFPSLTILNVEVSDGTYYRMQATNRDGTTVSSTIYLNISTRPPVVSVGRTSLTAATRASLSLQVNYTSGPEMKSISWEKGSSYYSYLYVTVNITANSRFTGGTIDSPSLEINDVELEDSGYYRCRVTNNDGTSTTPVFTVLVQTQPANVNVGATTYSVSLGNNATLYVTITNLESNSTITWERQGENEAGFNLINTQNNVKYGGGTLFSPSLAICNITDTDVGYYRCKVTNIDGTTTSSLIYIGLKTSSDDSSCDKLSCGGLRECVLKNNKPTCSVSTWKAAAVAVAGTVGAAASVAAGVAALKSLTSKAIQPLNGNGNSQGSNSNSNNRNNRNNNDNNDDNSDNNNSDDDNSDRESNHGDHMPDHTFIGGFQGVINSMPPPSI